MTLEVYFQQRRYQYSCFGLCHDFILSLLFALPVSPHLTPIQGRNGVFTSLKPFYRYRIGLCHLNAGFWAIATIPTQFRVVFEPDELLRDKLDCNYSTFNLDVLPDYECGYVYHHPR